MPRRTGSVIHFGTGYRGQAAARRAWGKTLESKTNYTVVGLLVVLLTVGIIGASVWLSTGFDPKKYDTYIVYMHEAVSGLSEDAAVKFNGVKVGYVKNIHLNRSNPQQVRLTLYIQHDVPITTSTSATLVSQGITGTTYVGLSASSSDLQPLLPKNNEPYPVIPSKASLFNQLDNALKGVSENINEVTIDVKRLFDKENAANLKKILLNLRNFSTMLEESAPQAQLILTNFSKASEKLPDISIQFHSTMTEITQKTLPSLNLLLVRLNQVALNLEKTSRDVKSNPSVIIRGTTPPKSGPGE